MRKEKGELLNFMITLGDVDDRKPLEYKAFIDFIYGKLFGDKGDISKNLFQRLFVDGIQLITKLKSNMKGCLIRCHCCLLSVSKEAVHQCTKNYGYTACIVLNSSNSRYFIWLVNLFFLLCRREIISNDISSEWSTAKNYPILCLFLHFIFGQSK